MFNKGVRELESFSRHLLMSWHHRSQESSKALPIYTRVTAAARAAALPLSESRVHGSTSSSDGRDPAGSCLDQQNCKRAAGSPFRLRLPRRSRR